MRPHAGVNVRKVLALGHALGSHRVMTGDHRRAVGGRERCQRRLHPCQAGVAMDMSKQCFDAGDERLAVEQFADRDCCVERDGITLTPGSRAEVGVDIGGRRNAAGENARASFGKARFR